MKKVLILISLMCLFLVGCGSSGNVVSSSVSSDNENINNNTEVGSSNESSKSKKYFSTDFAEITDNLYDNYNDTDCSVARRRDEENKIYYVVICYYEQNDIDSETHMPSDNKDREILSNIDTEELEKNNKKFNEMIKEYPEYEDWRVITRVENDGNCLLEIDD